MAKSFRVEYRAGRTSKPQYLASDQKTVNDTGYQWNTEKAAVNALTSFKVKIGRTHQPCASLRVIDSAGNAVVDLSPLPDKQGEKKADAPAEAAPETPAAQEQNLSADTVFADDEFDSTDLPGAPGALEAAMGAETTIDSEEAYRSIISASTAWSQVMAHFDEYQRMFLAQQSEEDKRTQDILHYIELNALPDDQAVAVVKRLAACRKRRREAKDALALLDELAPAKFAAQAVAQVLSRMDTRTYTPRVDADLTHILESAGVANAQAESAPQDSADAVSAENANAMDADSAVQTAETMPDKSADTVSAESTSAPEWNTPIKRAEPVAEVLPSAKTMLANEAAALTRTAIERGGKPKKKGKKRHTVEVSAPTEPVSTGADSASEEAPLDFVPFEEVPSAIAKESADNTSAADESAAAESADSADDVISAPDDTEERVKPDAPVDDGRSWTMFSPSGAYAKRRMAEIVAERRAEAAEADDALDLSDPDKRAVAVYMDHEGGATGRALAKRYGVSEATISRDIARGKSLVQAQLEDDGVISAFSTKSQEKALKKAVNSASRTLLSKWADKQRVPDLDK